MSQQSRRPDQQDSLSTAQVAPFCLVTVVDPKGLDALLESAKEPGALSSYQDSHPWMVAARLLSQARELGLQLPLCLATEGAELVLSHWAMIEQIDVLELSGKRFSSRIRFGPLAKIPAIFEPLDSLFLKPADEQLEREYKEGIRSHRHALGEAYIRPYAICESPGFISGLADWHLVLPTR